MRMKVEKSTVTSVREKLQQSRKRPAEKEESFEEKIDRMRELEEQRAREKKEEKRRRKEEARSSAASSSSAAANNANDDDDPQSAPADDPELAAAMGFGGFGSSKRK